MSEFILRDLYLDPIKKQLEQANTFFWDGKPPDPPTDEQRRKWRVEDQWRKKREAEAYALAPWLKGELEAAESYY